MRREYYIAGAAAILNAGIAFATGYYIGKKRGIDLNYANLDDEVDGIRQHYLERKRELEDEFDRRNTNLIAAEEALNIYRGSEEVREAAKDLSEDELAAEEVDFEYDVTEDVGYDQHPDDVKAKPWVETNVEPTQEAVIPEPEKPKREFVDKTKPYVISPEEFLEGYTGNDKMEFSQSTLTYYEGDDTLTDDKDNIMDDSSRLLLVGMCLSDFGAKGASENEVFIRNMKLYTDLEVVRDRRTYKEVVGGFGDTG